MVHSHTMRHPLGAMLSPCTMCGAGDETTVHGEAVHRARLTPSLAALAAQVTRQQYTVKRAVHGFLRAHPEWEVVLLGLHQRDFNDLVLQRKRAPARRCPVA